MNYCKRCVYPARHPLNLVLDESGICSGCRVHEEKDEIDWTERLVRLRAIVDSYRSRSRTIHDCIVPVSGGRDSYFIVHVVKNVLGLNPLLVSYNQQYNTKIGIRNLSYLRSLLGCDQMSMTVSPDRVKRITRETLRLRGSMYWHCIAGQTVFPVQIAVKFKIPLIIWGAHQGVDQVGMFSHLDEVEMTRKYRMEHDLMGLEAEDLLAQSSLLDERDIEQFRYPHDKELEAIGVRGIYLNNYLRWDSKAQHEEMIRLYGYETDRQPATFDTYNDVDSFHYSGIHDYLKRLKWGYGKVTDHASREIRLRRLVREDAIKLVSQYESVVPHDLDVFLDWLEMGAAEFHETVEPHRNLAVWQPGPEGVWALVDHVSNHAADAGVEAARLGVREACAFDATSRRSPDARGDKYILVGRGWADDWVPNGEVRGVRT